MLKIGGKSFAASWYRPSHWPSVRPSVRPLVRSVRSAAAWLVQEEEGLCATENADESRVGTRVLAYRRTKPRRCRSGWMELVPGPQAPDYRMKDLGTSRSIELVIEAKDIDERARDCLDGN